MSEDENRAAKAVALTHVMADAATRLDATHTEIVAAFRQANDVERAKYARVAGVRVPSEKTWMLACDLLAGRLAL